MKKLVCLYLILMAASTAMSKTKSIDEIKVQLNETQWTGLAGVRIVGSYQVVNDVNMAFQVHNGKLYYLSKINNLLDGKIEKKAQGLCVKSPPREAVLFPSDDGSAIHGKVILPELIEATGEHKFYSIPVLNFNLNESLLTFDSIPITVANKKMNVGYRLNKVDSQTTRQLADDLRRCLETQPWVKKTQ